MTIRRTAVVDAWDSPAGTDVTDLARRRTRLQNAGPYNLQRGGYGNLPMGYRNDITGAGGGGDKGAVWAYFAALPLFSQQFMENLYQQSWAAGKMIDIPVDDQFIFWRVLSGMSPSKVKRFHEVERDFDLQTKLKQAMKSGRLHGTGMVVVLTHDSPPEMPLNINMMRRGDLANLLVFNRHRATVPPLAYTYNPYDVNYDKPYYYQFWLRNGGSLWVHHSRVLEFHGIMPLESEGWRATADYYHWGVSLMVRALVAIFQEESLRSGITHLATEASLPVVYLQNFREVLSGEPDPDDITPEQMGQIISVMRSIYKTTFVDAQDKFERVNVTWSGLPDIMNAGRDILAAIADIPMTRFLGSPPRGLNATGASDLSNYGLKVASDQRNELPGPLDILDRVMARHIGMDIEGMAYEWPSIITISDKDRAETAKMKMEIADMGIGNGIMDENEGRAMLDGDPVIGDLERLPESELARRRENSQPAPATTGFPGNNERE